MSDVKEMQRQVSVILALMIGLLILGLFGLALYMFFAYLMFIFVGAAGIALLVGAILLYYHIQQKRIVLREAKREEKRLAHEQTLARDRFEHEKQLAREKHEFELRLLSRRFELEQHLSITRVLPDEKGNYPYIVTPDNGYLHLPNPQMKQIAAPSRISVQEDEGHTPAHEAKSQLPTDIRYEDVRYQVPRGHILVGVGSSGIETKERAVGACVWIVGLSGTGKTSTTVLRVEERKTDGHAFMGVDPHWFKPDSLTNAVKPYAQSFMRPIARTTEEIHTVLLAFLEEFKSRRDGRRPQPWQKITLLVDEVNALMDATDKQEEENANLLKIVARICGQEARNFNMGGIFCSQQATGLAWLRKVALMVIVHQLLMESEKNLACNGDTLVAREMKSWPIGRTYVYGVGFQEGPRVVQQPHFTPTRVVDAEPVMPDLPMKAFRSPLPETDPILDSVSADETAPEASSKIITPTFRVSEAREGASVKKEAVSEETKRTIKRMNRDRVPHRQIAKYVGLAGEKYPLYRQVCEELGIELLKKVEEA